MKILYVEDDPRDVDLVRRELKRRTPDVAVDVALNLKKARAFLAVSGPYDVALVDLRLPDGSGMDLLAEIRKKSLPLAVVVLTGQGDEETAVAVLRAGADDYLSKRQGYLERLSLTLEDAVKRFRTDASRRSAALRVLYAEHNPVDVDLTRRHLARHAPYILIDVVHRAEQIFQRLPQTGLPSFDVLLLDYRLPGLNALEILKIIRNEYHLKIPMVIVTGQGDEEIAIQSLKLGAADYLVKHPGYLFELPAALENAFHRFRLSEEQESLRKNERHLRLITENMHDTIWITDLNLKTIWISPSVTRTRGYTLEELSQMPLDKHLTPESLQKAILLISHYLTPERLSDPSADINVTDEFEFYKKDGTTLWVEANFTLLRDPDGSPSGLLGVGRDITERKQAQTEKKEAESALMETANFLRQLINAIPVPIFYRDLEGCFRGCNTAFENFLGLSRESILGKTVFDISSKDLAEIFQKSDQEIIRRQGVHRYETLLQHADGTLHDVLITKAAHRDLAEKVIYHRQSRWLENPEPLKAVVNLEPPKGSYSNNFIWSKRLSSCSCFLM